MQKSRNYTDLSRDLVGHRGPVSFSLKTWLRPGLSVVWAALFVMAGAVPGAAAKEEVADRVIDALGGRDRLKATQTIRTMSHSINFGSMTSYAAGAPPIHLSDNDDVALWEPLSQRFRIHSRLEALTPFPGGYDFEEAFDGTHATRSGPKDYRPGDGPEVAGAYLGARLKKLWLDHPQWLLLEADQIKAVGDGKEILVIRISALNESWIMAIDSDSYLPTSVTVEEVDGLRGRILVETRYSDWRQVDGVMMPFRVVQVTDGVLTRRETRTEIGVNIAATDSNFRLADTANIEQPTASDVTWGWSMSHWFLGRFAMGRSSDVRQVTPVALREIAGGIFQVTGTTHHNLVIVGANSLAVIEAPFYPARSEAVMAALRDRWPDKPISHLILTHHHLDHVGGMRTYIEAGARLVLPEGNSNFFDDLLEGSGTEHQKIFPVRERAKIPGFSRPMELLSVPNSHAFDMIIAYFPEEKLMFATDIYSPGRPGQPPNYPAELLQAIRFYNLEVEQIIGGHGAGPDDFSRFMEFAQ